MTDILAFMDKMINQKRAQSSETLWNRQFVIINVITTLAFFAEYMLVTSAATLYAAMDIGVALGSLSIGMITARFDFTAAFLVAAGIVLADLVLFLVLQHD